jgi:hypothetical protein
LIIEEECTRKHLLSRGNLLHGGVVGTANPRCWAPLLAPVLIHPNCWEARCIALLGLTAIFGELTDLPTIVARVTNRRELLWWSDCHLLLLLCWRRVIVLLLLWVVAPELWERTTQLSHEWCIDHVVLQRSTARIAFGGCSSSSSLRPLHRPSWCPLGQWQHLLAHCMTSSERGSSDLAAE